MRHLVSGGARSGKSAYAESLAFSHQGEVCYIATAERRDDAAFAARIAHHAARRPDSWVLVEAGRELATVLAAQDVPGRLLLLDCLGMWVMRFFDADGVFDSVGWHHQRDVLLSTLTGLQTDIVLVSNEIGWGVVPLGQETRDFVDELGRLNQLIAARCERVTLVACGLPLSLKV